MIKKIVKWLRCMKKEIIETKSIVFAAFSHDDVLQQVASDILLGLGFIGLLMRFRLCKDKETV